MDKFKVKLEGTSVVASYDGNSDGENSASLKLHLKEVYEELMDKGEATIKSTVTFKRSGGKINVSIDSDKDGEAVAEIMLDLLEGLEEAM